VAPVLAEVFDDDVGLLGEVVGVQRDEADDGAPRLADVVLGVVGDRLADLPVRRVGRVVRQPIEDAPIKKKIVKTVVFASSLW
jgi:hypothetical protein